jgi:uncharacterized OB-fold protein
MSVSKYWREIPHRYRLEAGKCEKCGKLFFPKRLICDECGSQKMTTIKLSREGKLITYTVIHIGPSQFTDQAPYAVGIVELKEGVRFLTQLADCDLDKLKSGMPMRIEFRRISEQGDAGILNYGYKCVPN